MIWTAVLPLKQGPDRKSRLSARLSGAERAMLGDHMAGHVLDCLLNSPSIGRVVLLSRRPLAGKAVEWRADEGRGLNAELDVFRNALAGGPLLVVHGDLPLLAPDDVEAIVSAAATGCALAPDQHGAGTNAIALAGDMAFAFAFGENSLSRHLAASGERASLVRRPGLALDVDTPDDLDAAIRAGFQLPPMDIP